MSKIDEMIAEVCPRGVIRKSLSEVCSRISSGGTPNRSNSGFFVGDIPWIRTQEIDFNEIFDAEIKITDSAVKSSSAQWVPADTVILAMYGATAGKSALLRIPATTNQACCNLEIDQSIALPEYVFHWLRENYLSIKSLGQGTQSNLNAKIVRNLVLPIPPLEVQREIVSILDGFTELGAELEAELEARKTQFEFYRNQVIFCADETVEWTPFGEVASISRGASPRPIQKFITDAEDGTAWVKIGDTKPGQKYLTSTSQRISPEGVKRSRRITPGDFILSNSMSFGRPYISKIDGCIHDGWLAISAFHKSLDSDFLYHVLQSRVIQMEFARRANSGSVSNLNAEIVKSVELPIPGLKVQKRIASKLNNFEALVNDQRDGLPAEIKARRQQYEHYRNKLLTFNELVIR